VFADHINFLCGKLGFKVNGLLDMTVASGHRIRAARRINPGTRQFLLIPLSILRSTKNQMFASEK
jgi:hypothetical protein